MSSATACRLVTTPQAVGTWSLAFELFNDSAEDVVLTGFEPNLQFALTAVDADGEPLEVHQPAWDIGLRPWSKTLAPGARMTVATPVILRVDANAKPVQRGFEWTIIHDPAGIMLRARTKFPAPFASCESMLAGSP